MLIRFVSSKLNNVHNPNIILFFKEILADAYEIRGMYFSEKYQFKEAILNFEKSIDFIKSIRDTSWLAMSYYQLGMIYKQQCNYPEAIDHIKESIELFETMKDYAMINFPISDLAVIYIEQKDTVNAIYYRKQILNYATIMKDTFALAYGCRVIAEIYSKSDFNKSIKYYNESIKYNEAINQNGPIAIAYTGIAFVYGYHNDYENAFAWMDKSLDIYLQNNFSPYSCYYSYGLLYFNKKDYQNAKNYFLKSINSVNDNTNLNDIVPIYNKLTETYLMQNHFNEAEKTGLEALAISKLLESPIHIKNSSELLYKALKFQEKTKEALDVYELFVLMKDSLNNEEINTAKIRTQFENEYAQKKIEDEFKISEERKLSKLKFEKEKTFRYTMYVGITLLLILSGFIFYRFLISKRQNKTINKQKKIVEEQHQEIKDSLEYAKRIQSAILPPARIVKEYLQESFILYKPKDIVAGDFYWMEQKNGKTLFAAADCTGHGVPGAMVSVICNGALNRSVREFGLSNPGQILDKAREIVIQEFEKSDEEVKDGMDIALCSLDGKNLEYAGAHNPLWILRNNEIIETKADKQPVGKYDNLKPYTTHFFELQKHDVLYIFSDGFVDQFGGEKGKKFKAKAFKEILLSIQNKAMHEQKLLIEEAFETWRGNLEQIDDICIIGVRI